MLVSILSHKQKKQLQSNQSIQAITQALTQAITQAITQKTINTQVTMSQDMHKINEGTNWADISDETECIGCESGVDNSTAHQDENGNYHPNCHVDPEKVTEEQELLNDTDTSSTPRTPRTPRSN